VCASAHNRSKTAEEIYSREGYSTKSLGIYNYAHRGGYSDEWFEEVNSLVNWADLVVAMNIEHEEALRRWYNVNGKPIITLNIKDEYRRGEPVLVELIRTKFDPVLEIINRKPRPIVGVDEKTGKVVSRHCKNCAHFDGKDKCERGVALYYYFIDDYQLALKENCEHFRSGILD
jgi:predicted protein tyrosine phosphatase